MKPSVLLPVASLLSLVLLMIHLTGDVLLQPEGSVKWFIPVAVYVVWLYGTLMLSNRVSGYIIMLLAGLISAAMIYIHARTGVVRQSGGFYFVFTMFALGATGWFTAILAARALWLAFRARRAPLPNEPRRAY
jgi:hypothetical protein